MALPRAARPPCLFIIWTRLPTIPSARLLGRLICDSLATDTTFQESQTCLLGRLHDTLELNPMRAGSLMKWLRALLHPALQVVEVYVPLLLPGAFGRRGTEAVRRSQEVLLAQP